MDTIRILAISVMAMGFSVANTSLAQTFTYIQIDVPNSSQTFASSSNMYGQIVGEADDVDGTGHGFLRDTDGTYIKFDYPGGTFTNAQGINDQGMIVGRWTDSKGYNHAYLRSPSGVFTNFDPPAPCFRTKNPTTAHRINNQGDIVGRCFSPSHREYAWILHSDGTFQILTDSNFDGYDAWFAPNGSQYIAGGEYGIGAGQFCAGPGQSGFHAAGTCFAHGVLWNRNGGFTTLDVHNSQTSLRSMNSSGDITGIYLDDALARVHGFLLRNGVVTNIDFPNSTEIDNTFINDLGLIVGAFVDAAGAEHGFIATCSGNGC
jgi:hypothetical protein